MNWTNRILRSRKGDPQWIHASRFPAVVAAEAVIDRNFTSTKRTRLKEPAPFGAGSLLCPCGFLLKHSPLGRQSSALEGTHIDSLNMANLRRRVNRSLVVQEAHHTVRIIGEGMEIVWKYSGYCRSREESAMDFSIDSEDSIPFDKLECTAFDLGHDPSMNHAISPILIGPDGISKKISVPFLEPLRINQPFELLLKCSLPNCVTAGSGYYTSTLSFGQARVRRCAVNLIFLGTAPSWMRVYESTSRRQAKLVKTLSAIRQEPGRCEYLDVVSDRRGRSVRIYTFWRDSI